MPELEYAINPRDPELNIEWEIASNKTIKKIISIKDAQAPSLEQRKLDGLLPK